MAELARKLRSLTRIGKVVEVGADGRVKVSLDGLVTTWLRVGSESFGEVRSWNIPVVGEQVMVQSPEGDLSRGVVTHSLGCDTFSPPTTNLKKHRVHYSDGAYLEYDRVTHKLTALLPSGGAFDVTAPGGMTVSGPFTVNGASTFNGNVETNGTLKNNSKTVGSTHTHGGVQTGGGTTGAPT